MTNSTSVSPIILGLEGPTLGDAERELIERLRPFGFLLFARNIQSPQQTRALCEQLRLYSPFIAVDQEGGRVQRLHNKGRLPAAKVYGDWYEQDPETALKACQLGHILLAEELTTVGANWALTPVLDVAHPYTHAIIGDRAFSDNPEIVAALGAAALEGLRAGGCLSCLKHAPGHGRAAADSHAELPTVNASLDDLMADAEPFRRLAKQADFIMTAHIRYPAWDAKPATNSPDILTDIRNTWNFNGLIVADDIGMNALQGTYAERAQTALMAGCDLIICSLSQLKAGMAGTVYHQQHAAELAHMPTLMANDDVRELFENPELPEVPSAKIYAQARAEFDALLKTKPSTV